MKTEFTAEEIRTAKQAKAEYMKKYNNSKTMTAEQRERRKAAQIRYWLRKAAEGGAAE